MSQDPALPKFEVPIADKSGVTTKNWYFFFSQLLQSITGGVTKIIAGTNVTISPPSGVGNVTVNATGAGGVTQIVAGTNVSISPPGGTGVVTVNSSGGTGTVTSVAAGSSNIVISGTPTIAPVVDLSAAVKSTLAGITTAVPGTIPDLQLWWESDNILGSSGTGFGITRLQERTPWIGGLAGAALGTSLNAVSIDPTLQNGFPVLLWTTNVIDGVLAIPYPVSTAVVTGAAGINFVNGGTFFIVAKGATSTGTQAVLGGLQGALALYLVLSSGTAAIGLVKSGQAVIGAATTNWTPGTFFQANATYNPTTGAYAFRQGRATAGSGTGSTGAGGSGNQTNLIGGDVSNSSFLRGSSHAAIIAYNRVLSGPEITSVENYLFSKWGV